MPKSHSSMHNRRRQGRTGDEAGDTKRYLGRLDVRLGDKTAGRKLQRRIHLLLPGRRSGRPAGGAKLPPTQLPRSSGRLDSGVSSAMWPDFVPQKNQLEEMPQDRTGKQKCLSSCALGKRLWCVLNVKLLILRVSVYAVSFTPQMTTFQASQRTKGIRVRTVSSCLSGIHHRSRSGVSPRIRFQ